MQNLTGQTIDRYHILEQIGEGGMAVVYKAYDTRLETEVAIKLLRKDDLTLANIEKVQKRFEREAKALARLTHPNLVKVIDYGEHEGMPYLVMPYLPGGTLKQLMGKPMPYEEAKRYIHPIASALSYAHSQGILHRDIKPSNILITQNGEPMLSDFGIAKILEEDTGMTMTGAGVGIGTPEYMAPEQGLGREVDARADIYSLGIVLYELVTGRKPYSADTPMAVIFKHISDPLPSPRGIQPGLPAEVEKLLTRALAKDRSNRYQSMDEMTKAMDRVHKQRGEDTSQSLARIGGRNEGRTPDKTIEEGLITREKREGYFNQKWSSSAKKYWMIGGGTLVLFVVGVCILLGILISGLVRERTSQQGTRATPELDEMMMETGDGSALQPTDTLKEADGSGNGNSACKIAFVSNRNGNDEIYVMNDDGTNIVRLSSNDWNDYSPVWSPDGRQIAFTSKVDNHDHEIFVVNADGSNLRQLTNNDLDDWGQIWSPDGSKLLFETYRHPDFGQTSFTEINLINTDGSEAKTLMKTNKQINGIDLTSDGSKIAIGMYDGTNDEIFTLNIDGSNLHPLTESNRANYYTPKWSPDDSKLAFEGSIDGYDVEISVVNSDGSNLKQVTSNDDIDTEYDWSPNGKEITYASRQDNKSEIFLTNLNLNNHQQLTISDETYDDRNPVWSPGGTKIIFESFDEMGGGPHLYMMNKDGTALQRLTGFDSSDTSPMWSPLCQ